MTRKDYIAVAQILADNADSIAPETHERLVDDFARFMAQDNPRFDWVRFSNACGVPATEAVTA
jgi:hypothetical protein